MQLKENDQLVFQAQHQCFEGKLKTKVKNRFYDKSQRGTDSLQEVSISEQKQMLELGQK